MARSAFSVSRSVALSLAALLVLTGAMFMVTTFQQDSEEWVLVEDEVLSDMGVISAYSNLGTEDDTPEYTFFFDEETGVYTFELTGGTKEYSTTNSTYCIALVDGFDYSKDYKIVFTTETVPSACEFYTVANDTVVVDSLFNLKSVEAVDGVYTGSIVLLDQYMTDFEYKTALGIQTKDDSVSFTFGANTFTVQLYELQTDNTGSIAAGFTGLVLIVMGVFAMPMHNILRRK